MTPSMRAAAAVAAACEREILHETANMYCNSRLEICLNGNTHATVIGKANSVEHAKRVMEKLERYPKNLELLR